jgi:hypothetical protein
MAVAIPLIAGYAGTWAAGEIGVSAAVGWAVGSAVGSIIERKYFGPSVPSNSLTDLQVQTSSWGVGLPEVFGTQRLAGNIIWSTDKLLVGGNQGKFGGKGGGGGKGGAGKGKKGTGSQGYYVVAIAFALAEGPIGGIKRIWAGGDLIFDDGAPVYVPSMDPSSPQGGYQTFTANNQPITSSGGSSLGTWTLYHGTNLQTVDPTIAANGSANGPEGVPYQQVTLANGFEYTYGSPQFGKMGTACAYRGVAYIVFDALNCGYGGTIPPLTFEVVGQPGTLNAPAAISPIYNPIPASLFSLPLGYNATVRCDLIDADTLAIPTGLSVAYCNLSGQLKQYVPPGIVLPHPGSVDGLYPYSVIKSGSALLVNCNYSIYSGPARTLLSWAYLSNTSALGGDPYAQLLLVDGEPWGVGSASTGSITAVFNPLLSSGSPNYYADAYSSALVAPTAYNAPAIAIGGAIYLESNTAQSVVGFDTVSNAFTNYVLPLNAGTTLINWFTDGIYFYAVDNTYLCYKIQMTGEIPDVLVTTFQLPATTNGFFFANGWLYCRLNLSPYTTLYKLNPDGSIRYTTVLPDIWSQAIVCATGIVFIKNNYSSTTTGATYFLCSFGDTTLTPTAPTLPEVLQAVCARAGFSATDVSLVPALPVNLTRRAGNSARDVLKVLCQVYQMDMVDSAGTLRFVPKGQNIAGQLGYDDIGYGKSVAAGAQPPAPYIFTMGQGTDLPRSVVLKYTSALTNYNPDSQFFQLHDPYGKDVSISVPLTLDDRTALTAAMLMCVEPHIESTSYSWTLNFAKGLNYEPGDVLQMPWGVTRITQATLKDGQLNPTWEFRGVIDASYVINSGQGSAQAVPVPQLGQPIATQAPLPIGSSGSLIATQGQPSSVPGQVPTRPPLNLGVARASLVEVPPLQSNQSTPFYLIAPYGTGSSFAGAAIYESTDGGTTYAEIAQQGTPGVVGWTPQALASTQPYTWDTGTLLNVYLNAPYMQLSSATDPQVIQGANLALIGSELIQSGVAQLLTDANGNAYYQLSRLLRGRRGTEWAMGSHVAGETFTLILATDETVIDYGLHDLNNSAQFKVATVGQSIANVNAMPFAPTGVWFTPFSVAHLTAALDGSGNWNIAFVPRARLNGWWGSGYAPSLDPDTQTWSMDIWNNYYDRLARTVSGPLTSPAFQYTAAMQAADGYADGMYGFRVYQVSSALGRGTINSVNVT